MNLRLTLALSLLVLPGCVGASLPAQDSRPASQAQAPASKPQPATQQPASKPQGPQIPAHKELQRTPSGLQYAILKAGKKDAKKPRFGDRVKVHFTVWLQDGELLETTRKGREPILQMVGVQMLPGLGEGLTLVAEGGRIKLVVPPELAFGDVGGPKTAPGVDPVPPKATLVYEVELFEVEPGKKTLPRFTRVPADKEKPLEDGLRYTVMKAGKGDKPAATDICELRFALFNNTGQLLACSEMPGYRNLKVKRDEGLAKMLKFFSQALAVLNVGERCRFQVPAKLCYGAQAQGPLLPANSETIWELELVRTITPLPLPPFAMSPLAKTTRTKSGLVYEVIKVGAGKTPGPTDRVEVHYAGWLTNGTLFDASFSRGETVTFPLGQVIPGWTEGLQLMKEGAVYKFTIPGDLAYGIRGQPRAGIGPNETLVFHVELIRVLPPGEKDK
ncbi:MAG: FKBP-type peptidyl-prolyl cis-trans isomerase [Planctomycetota bacterium]